MSWTALYTKVRGDLVAARGRGATGRTGADLPPTFAHEPFIFLALIWVDFVKAVKLAGGNRNYCYTTEAPDDPTGAIRILRRSDADTKGALSLETWLIEGKPQGDDPSVRYYSSRAFDIPGQAPFPALAYAYGRYNWPNLELSRRDPDPASIAHLMGKWNACIKTAGMALEKMATHPRLTPDQIVDWWSSWYQLLAAIEIVVENPPPTLAAQIVGGIKEATKASVVAAQEVLQATSEVAGRAAAEVAKSAGIAAGAATKGFFEQAGLTAYLVVAVAIAVALS